LNVSGASINKTDGLPGNLPNAQLPPHRSTFRMRAWYISLAAGVAILIASQLAAAQGGSERPPTLVKLDGARIETVETWREVTGKLRPTRRSRLAAEVEGRVTELLRREGAAVRAGEPIARLDDARIALELNRSRALVQVAEASITAAIAERDNASRDLARVRRVVAAGGGNEAELDSIETRLQRAEAAVAESEAQLAVAESEQALAEKTLRDHEIVAPFDGWVVGLFTEVGEWVESGGEVAEMISSGSLEAWLDVPEQVIARVRQPGTKLQIRVPALDTTVAGTELRIVPQADPLSRMFPVVVLIDDAEGTVRPGMSIVGLAPTGLAEPSLTVHKDAIRRDNAGEFVFFDAGGQAQPARVRVLFGAGERVAIRSETLPPGAMVVVEGNERLQPGTPIADPGRRSAAPESPAPGAPAGDAR
jgi:RND family efflux transporter MFP subunit